MLTYASVKAGAILSLTLYTVMVARYAGTTNKVGCGFGVFFVYLYATFYAFTLDSTSYVYCAEIFPAFIRATGMAVCIVAYFVPALRTWLLFSFFSGFANSRKVFGEILPLAFATIGWKFYLVFIVIPTCGLPIIWFYFPETNQLSLEEIASLFGEEVAIDITHMSVEQKQDLDAEITKINTNTLATESVGALRRQAGGSLP